MDKPKYNPKIHHRRSIRLKGYDYSQASWYFITICCRDMICRFGKIVNSEMVFNESGTIAYNEWLKLPERFANFELDVFQIMPNHIHGIVTLVGAPLAGAQRAGVNPAPTIGDIIGAYKSLVSTGCLKICKTKNETMGKLLLRNYYEHIITNEPSYKTISSYIINNPSNWKDDKFYKE